MKKIISLFFNFLLVIPLIFGGDEIRCNDVQGALTVCEKDDEWIYVNQTADKDEVIFNISGSLSIAPNAFQDLRVKYLFLVMENNSLEFQPKSFEGLEEVVLFSIYGATVSSKAKTFMAMSSLRSLHFTKCKIAEWNRETFAGSRELMEFSITESDIYTINFDTFRSIRSKLFLLNLNANKISVIKPHSFAELSDLENLQMAYNELQDIGAGSFSGLEKLQYLWLHHNHLTIIRKNVYSKLKKLKYLQLSHNDISIIEAGAFDGLSLQFLGLSCNKLTVISVGGFNGAYIDSLGISQNQTIDIERNAFRYLGLQEIYLNFDYNSNIESWGMSGLTEILSYTCADNEVIN